MRKTSKTDQVYVKVTGRMKGDVLRVSSIEEMMFISTRIAEKREGEVRLAVIKNDGAIRTIVSDNGEGIPPEDVPRIFERFYMGDKSRSQSEKGSGLGLAISYKMIGLHRSVIHVQSAVGKGSTFFFDLPIARNR